MAVYLPPHMASDPNYLTSLAARGVQTTTTLPTGVPWEQRYEQSKAAMTTQQVKTGIPGAIGAVGTGLSALGVTPGVVGTLGALGLAGYGIYQAFSGNGNGGSTAQMASTTMPYGIAGPGVQEPANGTWEKRWSIACNSEKFGGTWRVYFWKMWDGYYLCHNPRTGGWKRYKPRKNIVLSSNPRLSNVQRAVTATEGKLKRLAKKTKRLSYKA